MKLTAAIEAPPKTAAISQPVSVESSRRVTKAIVIAPVHATHETATTADAARDGEEIFITYKVITACKMFKIRDI